MNMITGIIIEKGAHREYYPGSRKQHLVPYAYVVFYRNGKRAYYKLSQRQWNRMKKIVAKLRRRVAWRHDIRYSCPSSGNDYNAHHYYSVERKS